MRNVSSILRQGIIKAFVTMLPKDFYTISHIRLPRGLFMVNHEEFKAKIKTTLSQQYTINFLGRNFDQIVRKNLDLKKSNY